MRAIKPPQDCGICGEDLKSGLTFFDASIPTYPYFGLWAWACSRCAEEHHVRVGTGCGQEYDSKTHKKVRGVTVSNFPCFYRFGPSWVLRCVILAGTDSRCNLQKWWNMLADYAC